MFKKYLIIFLLLAAPARAALVTQEVSYQDGDTTLSGYLAYDDALPRAAMPGVVIVHEWWGHNDYARQRADQIARLGYYAFALDMYGKGRMAATPQEAGTLSRPFYDDRALMRARAQAGVNALKGLMLKTTDNANSGDNIAVIGYCFGGTVALELARGGADIRGAVSFHGGLATPDPAKPGAVKARVLALNGGADPLVTQEEKDAFEKEMTDAGVTYKSIDYPGALHAFTNPEATETGRKFNMPVAYNAEADKQSFAELETFLKDLFPATP